MPEFAAILAAVLSIASPSNYVYSVPTASNAYFRGVGMGATVDYTIPRLEDYAFLNEAFLERAAFADVSAAWASFGSTNHIATLVTGFPGLHTPSLPWIYSDIQHDEDLFTLAYYDERGGWLGGEEQISSYVFNGFQYTNVMPRETDSNTVWTVEGAEGWGLVATNAFASGKIPPKANFGQYGAIKTYLSTNAIARLYRRLDDFQEVVMDPLIRENNHMNDIGLNVYESRTPQYAYTEYEDDYGYTHRYASSITGETSRVTTTHPAIGYSFDAVPSVYKKVNTSIKTSIDTLVGGRDIYFLGSTVDANEVQDYVRTDGSDKYNHTYIYSPVKTNLQDRIELKEAIFLAQIEWKATTERRYNDLVNATNWVETTSTVHRAVMTFVPNAPQLERAFTIEGRYSYWFPYPKDLFIARAKTMFGDLGSLELPVYHFDGSGLPGHVPPGGTLPPLNKNYEATVRLEIRIRPRLFIRYTPNFNVYVM